MPKTKIPQSKITNHEIARILSEIAAYLDMDAVPFKPRAFEKAAEIIADHDKDMAEIYSAGGLKALEDLPGVGVSIAEKIEELLKTGRLEYYEKLQKKMPVDISGLMAIEGIGPKGIAALYKELKIKNLDDLEKAAKAKKIRTLPRFGEKSEEKILKGIESVRQRSGRFPIYDALPLAESIEKRLAKMKEVEKISIAGSLRRWKETIGDIDILVISDKPEPVMEAFVNMREVKQLIAHGETKSSVKLYNGIDVDLRVVPKESFGAALNYFTGSKAHNVVLRQIAINKGLKLNEYGLFKIKNGKEAGLASGKTEEDIYEHLGLSYIPPEMREDTGEIELARSHKLPHLIDYDDLHGDLQVQTDWTDGKNSIEEMALAARERGLEYILITDHTKSLTITGGLDAARLRKQFAEIDRLNEKFRAEKLGITVLKGSECDVLKDGSLDLPDDILKDADVVGISVHSYTKLPKNEQTSRIIKAMENPHADILFHPTGRILGQREPMELDIDAVIAAAKRTGTVLEVNASYRLDLKDDHVCKAMQAGVMLEISSDAHKIADYDNLKYGIAIARRGWAEKKMVVNALKLKDFMAFFKKRKNDRF
jgi:DNA polymerase (family X)